MDFAIIKFRLEGAGSYEMDLRKKQTVSNAYNEHFQIKSSLF
jgi:hypothetical protein